MLDRLANLEQNIRDLRLLKGKLGTLQEGAGIHEKWALRYGLFESIQIMIDISCHLVSKFNLGNPKSYRECIELLQRNGYISAELSKKVNLMIGLRNILVHEYMAIEDARLYEMLDRLDDISEFVHVCSPVLRSTS
jgi:uncharacterized protein YutE (UPF0331/DUF86 family)